MAPLSHSWLNYLPHSSFKLIVFFHFGSQAAHFQAEHPHQPDQHEAAALARTVHGTRPKACRTATTAAAATAAVAATAAHLTASAPPSDVVIGGWERWLFRSPTAAAAEGGKRAGGEHTRCGRPDQRDSHRGAPGEHWFSDIYCIKN